MITKKEIENFIDKIPPQSAILKETLALLGSGELIKAAKIAQEDPALRVYLKNIVNKPIYGFKHEINDISQIFGILGVSLSQQTVYNYSISLLNPKKWHLFKLDAKSFHELQANLSKKWEKILEHLKVKDKEYYIAISLLPASIIVTEALFYKKMEDVALLRSVKALDYNTILQRLSGLTLFDICEEISKKWEMGENVAKIVQASSGAKPSKDKNINTLGQWMHLLLFYEFSNQEFIEAGLNDFMDFQVDYIERIYEDFAMLMEIK
jgi:HD-like signal output (HDOD) protein